MAVRPTNGAAPPCATGAPPIFCFSGVRRSSVFGHGLLGAAHGRGLTSRWKPTPRATPSDGGKLEIVRASGTAARRSSRLAAPPAWHPWREAPSTGPVDPLRGGLRRRVDRQRGAASIPCGLCTVELDRAARRRASRRDALKRRPPARVSRNGSGGHPTCPPTTSPVRQRAPAATATRGRWQRPEFFDERPRSRATLVGAGKGADRLTAPPRPRAPCGGWGLVPISMGSVVHTRGLRASARSLACEPTHRPPRQVSPLRT
jgi:hypothetical protein